MNEESLKRANVLYSQIQELKRQMEKLGSGHHFVSGLRLSDSDSRTQILHVPRETGKEFLEYFMEKHNKKLRVLQNEFEAL